MERRISINIQIHEHFRHVQILDGTLAVFDCTYSEQGVSVDTFEQLETKVLEMLAVVIKQGAR